MNNITLVICAYNCEKYIEETLSCIINQTFQNFDLLIINDCSTDTTIQLIHEFFKKNPRHYDILTLVENEGIANARQVGLQEAKTKYLLFVDSDDLPHPTLIEKQFTKIISDEHIMAVSSWSQFIDLQGKRIRGGLFVGSVTKGEFLSLASKEKLVFLPVQTLFNRETALKVGGYRLDGFPLGNVRYRDFCEDLDLWTRMSDLYKEEKYIITIPEVLYSYRKSNTGLSSNAVSMSLKMKYVKQNLKLRRKDQKELTFSNFLKSVSEEELDDIRKSAKAGYYLRNGFFLLKEYKILKGIYYLLKAITMNPKQFYQKIKANSGILK
ncbi:glycosyltransferase family 2 protein [Winogradskyella sp.]|nr:glycosyltransferase family 2 protein [Winogradskyella sp.]